MRKKIKTKGNKVKGTKKELDRLKNRLAKKEKDLKKLKNDYNSLLTRTQVLQIISTAMNSVGFNYEKILDFIMDLCLKFIKVEACSLLLMDEERTELSFKIAKGEKAELVKKYHLRMGEGIAGWVAKKERPLIVPEVSEEPVFKKDISEEIGFPTNSILCVPLQQKDKIIGVVELINKKGDKFNLDDLELLKLIANQAAIVLENITLFNQAEEKIKDLTALSEVTAIITSTLNLNEVLERIMRQATQLMRAEASALMLVEEETKELVFQVAHGEKGEAAKKFRLKIGEGIAGWVAQTGQPLLIPDVYEDSRFNPEVDKETGFRTKSILCVPLKIKDKIIGIVEVLNRLDGKSFVKEDVDIFTALANQAAVAIDNARLYEELRQLFIGTVQSLAEAIDAKSPYTHGHSERVSKYALAIAEEMGLSPDMQENVYLAGLLHDVGKIGIREEVLNKPGRLTDEEYAEIKRHPEIGAQIIEPVGALKNIIPGVRHHQERFDGRGYPGNLKEEEIPLLGRIIAVADTFDAMTSQRSYRDKFSDEIAVEEIKNCAGTQFDPKVVEAFLRAYHKDKIVKKYVKED